MVGIAGSNGVQLGVSGVEMAAWLVLCLLKVVQAVDAAIILSCRVELEMIRCDIVVLNIELKATIAAGHPPLVVLVGLSDGSHRV